MKKILIVEDDEMNLTLFREMALAGGYQVAEARTGLEAVENAASETPDVILMDIRLPDMDGVEALKKIRELPALRHTPVIAVTAYAMLGDGEKLLAGGFASYVPKPVNILMLLETIRSFA
jgi:two-component system cell cycle response regulator DivK